MNEPRVPLDLLDPTRREPLYWTRFQDRVMAAAAPEFARRRARGEVVSVSDIVLSWGRLLVPSALMAATAAGIFMAPRASAQPAHLGVEEALLTLVDEPVPELLLLDEFDASLIRIALEGG